MIIMQAINDLTGFNWPFEGKKHIGTIVLLPYREDTWPNGGMDALEAFYDIVKAISKYERVYLGVSKNVKKEMVKYFYEQENVEIINIEYNDAWARDNTLIFLNDGKTIKAVDFGFNAWGGSYDGLYSDYDDDNKLGGRLARFFDMEVINAKDFILEGGSIHTNGKGTIITTKACLLSKGRNPNLSQNQIENNLKKYLNAKKVIWLPKGIYEDETNEHVDNICCFLDENTVALAWCNDKNDPQYENSMACYEVLKKENLNVIKIPVPGKPLTLTNEEASNIIANDQAKPRLEGDRLAASYVNFYQGAKFVLVPQFGCPEDEQAIKILKDFYKDKEVIGINSRSILVGGGNIHCVTMQIGDVENE